MVNSRHTGTTPLWKPLLIQTEFKDVHDNESWLPKVTWLRFIQTLQPQSHKNLEVLKTSPEKPGDWDLKPGDFQSMRQIKKKKQIICLNFFFYLFSPPCCILLLLFSLSSSGQWVAISRVSGSPWDLEAKPWDREMPSQTVRVGRYGSFQTLPFTQAELDAYEASVFSSLTGLGKRSDGVTKT